MTNTGFYFILGLGLAFSLRKLSRALTVQSTVQCRVQCSAAAGERLKSAQEVEEKPHTS